MEPRDPAAAAKTTQKGGRASRKTRGALFFLLLFLALVLALDALVGDRGVFAVMQARREYTEVETALANARAQTARLREEERRLREDSTAIEELARQHLGLVKPGETLFIIKDVRKPSERLR
jgi:cell division protein FtsB